MENRYMKSAIEQARIALAEDEVPIGAIVVHNGQIVGRGYNLREKNNDVSAHAEIRALRQAASNLGTWKLDNCELYVTVEPCIMCYGAIVQSRVKKVYIGSKQMKFKKHTYRYHIEDSELDISSEYLDVECSDLMTQFFTNMRNKEKKC